MRPAGAAGGLAACVAADAVHRQPPLTAMLIAVLVLGLVGLLPRPPPRAGESPAAICAELHSLPGYYGFYVALWCGLPALLLAHGSGWLRSLRS